MLLLVPFFSACRTCPAIQASIFGGRQPQAHEGILALGYWSDKGVIRLGGRSYHPANLLPLAQDRGTVFLRAYNLRLGFFAIPGKEVEKKWVD